jgi:type IV secretory pathway VirB10-like protein
MSKQLLFAMIIWLSCWFNLSAVGQEQPPKTPAQAPTQAPTPSTSNELVEGLLDLLNEPPAKKPAEAPKQPLTPADVGLEGEDLGEASENPLLAVRQSMLIAAGYLRRDGANAETMKLQSDIVRRLDDLISELEKAQGKEDQSQQDSQQEASSQSNAQKQREQQSRSQTAKSRPGERKDSEAGEDRADRQGEPENPPTQRGNGGSAAVELADAKSLQQDVWGQLPSRVRQQMQSRMVEQFLPAYKEQIEAYFQALLK